MGWTVVKEDENGNPEKTVPSEFILSDKEILYSRSFRVLKYLDPYGNTTFNALMFDDLLVDLTELIELLPNDKDQIETLIAYTKECKDDVHTYLKFYGD